MDGDHGVVVVGAGVAGLAAAVALRREGVSVTVLEASAQIGGRARTTVPALLDAPFDYGASWLHAAHRNPLATMATQLGDRTINSDAIRAERTRLPGRFASEAELAEYATAERAFHACTAAALPGPDIALAEVVRPIASLPWLPAVVNWEAPVIAAADASALSLRDWHANQLEAPNWEMEGGLGAWIVRRLGPPAGPVRLGVAADRVRWDGHGVTVETVSGAIRAAAAIITVSTAVLGQIRFIPELPDGVRQAVCGLPMGLLNKVALRAAGADRLDLPDSCSMDQFVPAIDDLTMTMLAWPHGRDHVICFIGGSQAGKLEGAGETESFVRSQLRALFGARADAALRPGAVVTQWAGDPCSFGSYAYAEAGCAGARAVLGTPLANGRLVFAGEATRTDGLAGTVGGAFLAGEEAARTVTAALSR